MLHVMNMHIGLRITQQNKTSKASINFLHCTNIGFKQLLTNKFPEFWGDSFHCVIVVTAGLLLLQFPTSETNKTLFVFSIQLCFLFSWFQNTWSWWYTKATLKKLRPEWIWLQDKPVFHSARWCNSDGIHDRMQGATASSSSNSCCCICSHHLQVWSDIAPTMTMTPPWTGWTWVGSTTIILHIHHFTSW